MLLAELYYKYIKRVEVPYYAKYSLATIIAKPIRKIFIHNFIPYVPFNRLRVNLYKVAGFNIGRNVFIGMKSYLDDMDPHLITIQDNAIISFETCLCIHGRNQGHTPILIQKNAYIGCRATVVSGKNGIIIGENSVIGACSLVLKNVPENVTVVGIPARIVKNRS